MLYEESTVRNDKRVPTTPLAIYLSAQHAVRSVNSEKRQEGTHHTSCYIPFGATCCTKRQQWETTRGYPPHLLLYTFRRNMLYEASTVRNDKRVPTTPLAIYLSAQHAVRSVNSEKRQEGTHHTSCYIPFGATCCTKRQQWETTRGYPPHLLLYTFRRCMLYEESTVRNDKRVPTTPLAIYLSAQHAVRSVNSEKRQEGTHHTSCYIPFGATCCTKRQQWETTRGYPPHLLLYTFRRNMLYEASTVRNDKRVCGSTLLRSLTFPHGDTRKIHRCQADPTVHVHFRPGFSFGRRIETKLPIKVPVTAAWWAPVAVVTEGGLPRRYLPNPAQQPARGSIATGGTVTQLPSRPPHVHAALLDRIFHRRPSAHGPTLGTIGHGLARIDGASFIDVSRPGSWWKSTEGRVTSRHVTSRHATSRHARYPVPGEKAPAGWMKPTAVSAEPTAEQIGTVLEAPPTNLVMAQEDGEGEREETGAGSGSQACLSPSLTRSVCTSSAMTVRTLGDTSCAIIHNFISGRMATTTKAVGGKGSPCPRVNKYSITAAYSRQVRRAYGCRL